MARAIIVVHGIEQARAACAAAAALGVPVLLRSAEGAAAYAGAGWFHELIRIVRGEFPDADVAASLDCADAPGLALAALRQGIERIRYHGSRETAVKIGAIAEQYGAAIDTARGEALDLLNAENPEAACRQFLSRYRR